MNRLLESLAFVDIETTGLRQDRHSILSLGAVSIANPKHVFYEECQKEYTKHVDPFALEVNGFTEAEINRGDKLSVPELLASFDAWSEQGQRIYVLGGHNTWFDAGFMEDGMRRYKIDWRFGHRYVDLHSVFYAELIRQGVEAPPIGFALDQILAMVGLPPRPEGKPHNALEDAKLEAEAFYRIVCRDSLLSDYSKHPVPTFFTVA